MTRVAVVGARGFVGTAIVQALERAGQEVTPVTRQGYHDAKQGHYDVVVNAAMPSGRFWARNHPAADFAETVAKTADIFHGWRFDRFVQISSISARAQLDTTYGRHKAAAEHVCSGPTTLVVRLGPMYGPTLRKGVLIDMLEGRPVYAAGESRYCFAPLEFVGDWVARNLHRTGTVEVGARDSVSLHEIAKHLGKDISFQGAPDHQEVVRPEAEFPAAREVFAFLDQARKEAFP